MFGIIILGVIVVVFSVFGEDIIKFFFNNK